MSGAASGTGQLVLATSGGRREGFGHLARTTVLAARAIERGVDIRFAICGDETARSFVRSRLPGVAIEQWREGNVPGPPRHAGAWTLFDTRREITSSLVSATRGSAEQRCGRTLVLDRLDAIDTADYTVLPILHAPPIEHPRLRSGARWCLVDRAIRSAITPIPWSQRNLLLMTLGGSDPLGITELLCEALAAVLSGVSGSPRFDVNVVIGPGFRSASRLRADVEARGWRAHRSLDSASMGALMSRSAFALVGFGNTAVELALHGVPMIAFTHHERDQAPAERLEDLGIARFGGYGANLSQKKLEDLLGTTLGRSDWCAAASEHSRRAAGDGRGDDRILDLMGLSTERIQA